MSEPTILDEIQADLKGLKAEDFILPPKQLKITHWRSHGTLNDTARRLYTLGRQYGDRVAKLREGCTAAKIGLPIREMSCEKCPAKGNEFEITELVGRQAVLSNLFKLELRRQFPEAQEVTLNEWDVLEIPPTRLTMPTSGMDSFLAAVFAPRH